VIHKLYIHTVELERVLMAEVYAQWLNRSGILTSIYEKTTVFITLKSHALTTFLTFVKE